MNVDTRNWMKQFDQRFELSLQELDQFHESINDLQYEGKVSEKENIRKIETSLRSIKKELIAHIKLDEYIIFPFLIKHIPKLEPMLRFLSADHLELKLRISKVQQILKNYNHSPGQSHQMKSEATYLFCLMRNHYQVEKTTVSQEIRRELNEAEQFALMRQCRKIKSYINH